MTCLQWHSGVLGANPLWAGEENRAKDAKDAKVKGKKDEEIAGVAVEGALALRIQMPIR